MRLVDVQRSEFLMERVFVIQNSLREGAKKKQSVRDEMQTTEKEKTGTSLEGTWKRVRPREGVEGRSSL